MMTFPEYSGYLVLPEYPSINDVCALVILPGRASTEPIRTHAMTTVNE